MFLNAALAAALFGSLTVTVSSEQGERFPGTEVALIGSDGVGRVALSNSLGVADFPLVPPDRYRLSTCLDGHLPDEATVDIRAHSNGNIDLVLPVDVAALLSGSPPLEEDGAAPEGCLAPAPASPSEIQRPEDSP